MFKDKKIWESKTFWVAVIALLIALLSAFLDSKLITGELAITIMSIAMLVLRTVSKEAVKWEF